MKCDGHSKITDAALNILLTKCKVDLPSNHRACKLPDFQPDTTKTWSSDKTSNTGDNLSSAGRTIIDQLTPSIPALDNFRGHLTERVVAIDLDKVYFWNHFLDSGQRFHFMKAPDETARQAYLNGSEFIRSNAEKWIDYTFKVKEFRRNVIHTTYREKAINHLALALHCLQDTFSPGHVERTHSIDSTRPGTIKNIFVYDKKNKKDHSDHDYKSGSINSIAGQMAINATVDLILLCIKSYANNSYRLENWGAFKQKWINYGGTA